LRTKHSFKNALFSFGNTFIITILSFFARKIFVEVLSTYYLGLNGLFTNLISMLSLAELGIGTAITFSLYEPLANDNKEKIKALMQFYKKAYYIIGGIIFSSGFILSFFLDYIVKESERGSGYLQLVFILFLLNTSITYLFSYKRTLITADQKKYKLIPYLTGFRAILIIAQSIVLILTQNFILYLITRIIVTLIENLVINSYINKKYMFINGKLNKDLPNSEKNTIQDNIKAMFFHKIGGFIVNGTDNILISAFINVSTVGLYSNYGLVINTVKSFLMNIFRSMTASFGNLIAKENEDKQIEVFNQFYFLAFWVFNWASLCLYILINPFIELWLGHEYLINQKIINIVLINFYLFGIRVPLDVVKTSAGIFVQDKYVPLIESFVNFIVSIVLVQYWGLIGVFIGTLASNVLVQVWYRPLIVYKYVFKTSSLVYFKKYLKYFLTLLLNIIIMSMIKNSWFYKINYLNFIYLMFICFIIPNLVILLLFYKNDNFIRSKNMIINLFRNLKNK
jgi:O-antigen/teichoic acid export membrane protein